MKKLIFSLTIILGLQGVSATNLGEINKERKDQITHLASVDTLENQVIV